MPDELGVRVAQCYEKHHLALFKEFFIDVQRVELDPDEAYLFMVEACVRVGREMGAEAFMIAMEAIDMLLCDQAVKFDKEPDTKPFQWMN